MKRLAVVLLLVLVAASAWSVDIWVKGWVDPPELENAFIPPLFQALSEQADLQPAESEEEADVILIFSMIEVRNGVGQVLGFGVGISVVPVAIPAATGNALYAVAPTQNDIVLVAYWVVDYIMQVINNSIGIPTGGGA